MREIPNGKMEHVNLESFSKNNFKLKMIAVTTAIVMIGTGFVFEKNVNQISVPNGYDILYKNVYVYDGVTFDSLANTYYTETTKGAYPTIEKYAKIIVKKNRKKIMAGGILGSYISVPIVVSKEDPDYIRMQEILKEIKRIKKENYWLIAIPNSNDTILGYALKASGNEDEVIALAREIALKNGFNSINDNLTEGKSI